MPARIPDPHVRADGGRRPRAARAVGRGRRRGRPVPTAGGLAVLVRHSPAFRAFAFLATLAFPIGLTVLFSLYPPGRDETGYVLLAYAATVVVTVALYWEAVRYYVFATPQGIEGRSPWRGARYFAWDDVREVTFNPAAGWFAFEAWDGTASASIGRPLASEICSTWWQAHVPAAVVQKARPGWERLGRPVPRSADEPVLGGAVAGGAGE